MSSGIRGLACLIRRPSRRGLVGGLALVGIQWGISGFAYAQTAIPIAYGQIIQGTLGDTADASLPDGRPSDTFRFVTQAPNQEYAIRAVSTQIPIVLTLLSSGPQGSTPLVRARSFAPGQIVLFAGTLSQPGTYLIDIFSQGLQRPDGTYTLSLTCLYERDVGSSLDENDDCAPGIDDGRSQDPGLSDENSGDDLDDNGRFND